ncbi:MAG TPA: hypothetical protein DD990_05950, partial [Cyanobacteria bacterium UBA11368]|nr:hypothetical protein [Cyanobacteria bacterium UBA11368]
MSNPITEGRGSETHSERVPGADLTSLPIVRLSFILAQPTSGTPGDEEQGGRWAEEMGRIVHQPTCPKILTPPAAEAAASRTGRASAAETAGTASIAAGTGSIRGAQGTRAKTGTCGAI